jgi:hypothetical protein
MRRRVYSSPMAEMTARSVQKNLLMAATNYFTETECRFLIEVAGLPGPPPGTSLALLRSAAFRIIEHEKIDPLKIEFEGM